MKTLIFTLLCLFCLVSCFEKKQEYPKSESFYIYKGESVDPKNLVFKLSLTKEQALELDDKMGYYDDIEQKMVGMPNIMMSRELRKEYEGYIIVGKDSEGKVIRWDYLSKVFPFSISYRSPKDRTSSRYYSIEEFFTPEEKAKMLELIPEWDPTKKEELARARREIVSAFYIKESSYYKDGKEIPAKEIFKLSLDKKRTLELQDKIDYFKEINAREIGYLTSSLLPLGMFSKYELIGVDESGEEIDWNRFFYGTPFCLEYESKKKSFWGDKIEVHYYSIEDFFTPDEKKKMLELIPLWKAGKEKEREEMKKLWQDGWDKHAETFGVKEEATLSK